MYELRDKQTPYWFTNDEVSCIQESLGAVFLEKVKGGEGLSQPFTSHTPSVYRGFRRKGEG